MNYRGRVRNGKIELDEQVVLPEGAAIELCVTNGAKPTHAPRRALELLRQWCARPDEKKPFYWDDLERELSENRLSFRQIEPSG